MTYARIEPYDWQAPLVEIAVQAMRKYRVFVSGFPTGAGKTVIALAAARALGGPWLVVAPKVSLTAWHRTAERMGCADRLFGVINPEQISKPRGCEFYTRDRKWTLPQGTSVVWDEPHRSASGPKSVSTRALAELRAYARYVHPMTATLADSPLKLRAIGWLCGLHDYNDSSFYGWCRSHGCTDQEVGGFSSPGRRALKFTTNARAAVEHMAAIRRELNGMFMAVRADDIPGFPTQTLDVKLIDLDKRDRDAVDAACREMSDRMQSRARSPLAELNRERERIEFHMAETLADLAYAKSQGGVSAVCFFCYTEPRERFERKLEGYGVQVCRICGGQKDEERQAMMDAFQRNELHVASVQIKAGGASVSLHDELKQRPRESFLIPAYEAADVKQALGRIRRCEGTHAVQHFVIAAGTIQERVAATLERKLLSIDTLNDTDLIP